jgi:PPOX class probable F420-dependent enzyme
MALSDQRIETLLASWPVARLAINTESGYPQQQPIVFCYDGDVLWSPLDGKSKSGTELQRVKNIRNNPKACLLLDEYENDWSQLWWLRVDVIASVHYLSDIVEANNIETLLRNKYSQYQNVELFKTPASIIKFEIIAFRSWEA